MYLFYFRYEAENRCANCLSYRELKWVPSDCELGLYIYIYIVIIRNSYFVIFNHNKL